MKHLMQNPRLRTEPSRAGSELSHAVNSHAESPVRNKPTTFRFAPLASVVMLANASLAFNAHALKPQHDLEEVIVSASPIHNQHSDNARPVSVLSGDELRRNAASTLADTLTGQVGVSAASFGPGVGNPIIRGQSANRVKVMQDNLDTLDASNTSADHANTTEPLLADQIEILRGPSTLRFGSGAIGGVVNVIDNRIPSTSPDTPITGAVETRYSSVNEQVASVARIDGGSDQFAWHADGLYRDSNNVKIPGLNNPSDPDEASDGYIANTHSRADAYSLGASWIGERGFIGLSVNQQHNLYGIPAGAHSHHEEEEEHHDEEEEHHDEAGASIRIDMQQTRYDLKGELKAPLPGFDKLLVRVAHNDYEHTELEGQEAGTRFNSDAWEGRAELVHSEVDGWQGAFGFQLTDRDYGAEGEEAFIPRMTHIHNAGIFWIEEKHWQHQWLEIGLRVEQQRVNPDASRVNSSSVRHNAGSASLGYHWSLNDIHQFSIALSRAERAPSMEELLSDGAHIATQTYDLGDRELDNETSNNLDLGYEWTPQNPGLLTDIKVNLFYNQIVDYIYQHNTGLEDPASELPIYQYQQQDANFHGIELETHLQLSDALSLRLFADSVRARFDAGGDVPRISPNRVGAELTVTQPGWYGSVQLIEAGRQTHTGSGEEPTDGYTRLNAQVSVPLEVGAAGSLLFVRADNLLDEDIRHATSFLRSVAPEAGRGLTAGVRFAF
ncbi:TonB-dependent receptor [Aestuariicella hydrocarbonica]|uniref:TonB-dependent receptor n=1 Tax=Pseudomaricurvus hydrocarbonicus TaxID=1470433 RepID=A0A9E5MNK5_9GAMM|nr:TonB-dependent receptor [Aestuariicella hydrocarbonica]NHO67573.1 TonB-dependent receptor [Aestuariicella hydrocarbonica]